MSKEIKYKDVVPNSIVARYKEVRQEPVAWRTRQVGTADWQYHNLPHILDSTCQSLYLKPPKREPLSDDEMRAIWKEGIRCEIPFVEIGRAIEKAHGIGVDDEN